MKTPNRYLLACLVSCLVVLTHLAWAQTNSPSKLQQISVEGSDTHTVVTLRIDGDGVVGGTLEEIATAPFRLFIDLPNVIPHVEPATRVDSGGVDRVRVALNQSSPPVTRVVLDLNRRSPYRLERDPKSHTLRIVVGITSSLKSPDTAKNVGADEEYAKWFDRSAPPGRPSSVGRPGRRRCGVGGDPGRGGCRDSASIPAASPRSAGDCRPVGRRCRG